MPRFGASARALPSYLVLRQWPLKGCRCDRQSNRRRYLRRGWCDGVGIRASRLSHRSRCRDRAARRTDVPTESPWCPPSLRLPSGTSVAMGCGRGCRAWGAPAVIAGPPCQGYSAAGALAIGDPRKLLFRPCEQARARARGAVRFDQECSRCPPRERGQLRGADHCVSATCGLCNLGSTGHPAGVGFRGIAEPPTPVLCRRGPRCRLACGAEVDPRSTCWRDG